MSADQINEANPDAGISDPSVLNVGTKLNIPLPCTCFNNSDNNLPAIYMSYVVKPVDTLSGIAARYFTTLTDLMNMNQLGSPAVKEGDILAIPLSGTDSIPSLVCSVVCLLVCICCFWRFSNNIGVECIKDLQQLQLINCSWYPRKLAICVHIGIKLKQQHI